MLIPASGPVHEVQQHGLRDLQRLLDGPTEALPIEGREDAAAYVNEEGLLDRLPSNERATQLLGFPILGDAVVCGFDAATGEQTAIPNDLAQAVLAADASHAGDQLQD